jgi:hypothetical protein
LIPAWQPKVNPVCVRLRVQLSILLAADIQPFKPASPRRAGAEGRQNPSYWLQLWRHIEPVFVTTGDPNYDVRTPDMATAHGLRSPSVR